MDFCCILFIPEWCREFQQRLLKLRPSPRYHCLQLKWNHRLQIVLNLLHAWVFLSGPELYFQAFVSALPETSAYKFFSFEGLFWTLVLFKQTIQSAEWFYKGVGGGEKEQEVEEDKEEEEEEGYGWGNKRIPLWERSYFLFPQHTLILASLILFDCRAQLQLICNVNHHPRSVWYHEAPVKSLLAKLKFMRFATSLQCRLWR